MADAWAQPLSSASANEADFRSCDLLLPEHTTWLDDFAETVNRRYELAMWFVPWRWSFPRIHWRLTDYAKNRPEDMPIMRGLGVVVPRLTLLLELNADFPSHNQTVAWYAGDWLYRALQLTHDFYRSQHVASDLVRCLRALAGAAMHLVDWTKSAQFRTDGGFGP